MDITGLMAAERIITITHTNKEDALTELANVLGQSPVVGNADAFVQAILEREEIMSTGIGQEFAVPHAKRGDITNFAIALGLVPDGMDYGSLDKQPVRIICMIAAPEDEQNTYLRVLKRITEVLRVKANRDRILELADEQAHAAIIELFKD